MIISKATVSIIATTLAVAAALPTIATASEMTLTLKDQGISLSGQFAGFRQNAYILATEAGKIHVPARYVDCEGEDCYLVLSANTVDD